jgi:hypothetical protein
MTALKDTNFPSFGKSSPSFVNPAKIAKKGEFIQKMSWG